MSVYFRFTSYVLTSSVLLITDISNHYFTTKAGVADVDAKSFYYLGFLGVLCLTAQYWCSLLSQGQVFVTINEYLSNPMMTLRNWLHCPPHIFCDFIILLQDSTIALPYISQGNFYPNISLETDFIQQAIIGVNSVIDLAFNLRPEVFSNVKSFALLRLLNPLLTRL